MTKIWAVSLHLSFHSTDSSGHSSLTAAAQGECRDGEEALREAELDVTAAFKLGINGLTSKNGIEGSRYAVHPREGSHMTEAAH